MNEKTIKNILEVYNEVIRRVFDLPANVKIPIEWLAFAWGFAISEYMTTAEEVEVRRARAYFEKTLETILTDKTPRVIVIMSEPQTLVEFLQHDVVGVASTFDAAKGLLEAPVLPEVDAFVVGDHLHGAYWVWDLPFPAEKPIIVFSRVVPHQGLWGGRTIRYVLRQDQEVLPAVIAFYAALARRLEQPAETAALQGNQP